MKREKVAVIQACAREIKRNGEIKWRKTKADDKNLQSDEEDVFNVIHLRSGVKSRCVTSSTQSTVQYRV